MTIQVVTRSVYMQSRFEVTVAYESAQIGPAFQMKTGGEMNYIYMTSLRDGKSLFNTVTFVGTEPLYMTYAYPPQDSLNDCWDCFVVDGTVDNHTKIHRLMLEFDWQPFITKSNFSDLYSLAMNNSIENNGADIKNLNGKPGAVQVVNFETSGIIIDSIYTWDPQNTALIFWHDSIRSLLSSRLGLINLVHQIRPNLVLGQAGSIRSNCTQIPSASVFAGNTVYLPGPSDQLQIIPANFNCLYKISVPGNSTHGLSANVVIRNSLKGVNDYIRVITVEYSSAQIGPTFPMKTGGEMNYIDVSSLRDGKSKFNSVTFIGSEPKNCTAYVLSGPPNNSSEVLLDLSNSPKMPHSFDVKYISVVANCDTWFYVKGK
ncbi:hypothetical protein CAEBREN_06451 [Caenorhabditis brenneri]|uniref:Uncharacterized protein n=1 Tax=Caenorhabditis brenneri TaxID=135651 RepID=G0N1D1_CAEBE|nr:hypothetical protein CAEBREN_06451 [Caenorhabditis brenneri]